MKCKTCGMEFEDRSALGKHIWSEHKNEDLNAVGVVEKNEIEVAPDHTPGVVIPVDSLYELKFLSKNQPAQVLCMGHMGDEGLIVTDMRYHR